MKRGVAERGLGVALREAGDLEGAVEALERALQFLPEAPTVWAELSRVRSMLGQEEAALFCKEQMLRFEAAPPKFVNM